MVNEKVTLGNERVSEEKAASVESLFIMANL